MANHTLTTVDKHLGERERDQVVEDLCRRARSQTDLWNEYKAKYPTLDRTGFYDWCKGVLDKARQIREQKMKALIGLKHDIIDDLPAEDLDERMNMILIDKVLCKLDDDPDVSAKDIELFSKVIKNKASVRIAAEQHQLKLEQANQLAEAERRFEEERKADPVKAAENFAASVKDLYGVKVA